ncbi:hypothetical protein V6N13_113843 [Hibiscus sabdariffa]
MMKHQNATFLMKLAFNLIVHLDHLWAQVLRTKYKWTDFLHVGLHRANSSHLWWGISSVWPCVRDSLVWSFNDGRSIDFLRDARLGDIGTFVYHIVDYSHVSSLPKVLVQNMVDNTRCWLWHDCADLLPDEIFHCLAACMTPQQFSLVDRVSWKWTASHDFTVKFAYDLRSDAENKVVDGFVKLARFDVIPTFGVMRFSPSLFSTPPLELHTLVFVDLLFVADMSS